MEKTMNDYAAFEQAMDERKLYLELDFVGICTRIGVDHVELDEILKKELGFDGQSLVDYYRKNC